MKRTAREILRFAILCALTAMYLAGTRGEARTFGKGNIVSFEFPPPRPEQIPDFPKPRAQSLDEPWQFMQYLYDADTTQSNYAAYLNAFPVGMKFSHQGRGYIAALHTVFFTSDGGTTWRNLDATPPPPYNRPSLFFGLRSPVYISSISWRPVLRQAANLDTLLISAYNADSTNGLLRILYYAAAPVLWPSAQLQVNHWLHGVVINDSTRACAVAGLDGIPYYNDTLRLGGSWEELNPDKVLIRSGRDDSLDFSDSWISSITSAQNLVIAAGSHHWISRDGGRWWRIVSTADTLFDNVLSFSDSLHGLAGGGMISPQTRGWVHYTTDAAYTWSGRTLFTVAPIRAVHLVTPEIGFAAGGDYQHGTGEIWRTTDGGMTWQIDMQIGAEITALSSTRISTAYVNVVAAGAFPDFRGGVWKTRLYLPDTTGAILLVEPDTLNFGFVPPSERDTMTVTLRNAGSAADTITAVLQLSGSGHFTALWSAGNVPIAPDEEIPLSVTFRSDTAGLFTGRFQISNLHTGQVNLYCTAAIGSDAGEHSSLLPSAVSLAVWPNPANAMFQLRCELLVSGEAGLRIYDLNGRLVETVFAGRIEVGERRFTWNAAQHATGIYFARLDVAGFAPQTQKILLLK